MVKKHTVGVLALQGDYEAHQKRIEELGARTALVRNPDDLKKIDALVMPGGESSTMLKFLERDGFFDSLKSFAKTKPVFGTCAGAILLAKDVTGPSQKSLGIMDIAVRRNAYGRQLDSSIHKTKTKLGAEPLEMVFIRAPKIEHIGKNVEVLAELDGNPVLVRQGKTMAATFHPELSDDSRIHKLFLDILNSKSK
jgi:5'-phosphate synthase pdxT subunit